MAPSISRTSCLAIVHLPTRATSWFLLASLVPFFFPLFLLALPLLFVLLVPLYLFAVAFAFIRKPSITTLLVPPWRWLLGSSTPKSDPAHDKLGQSEDEEVVKEALVAQAPADDYVSPSSSSASSSPVAETEGRTQQDNETEKGSNDGDAADDSVSSSNIRKFQDLELEGDALRTEKLAAGEAQAGYLEAPLESDLSSSIHFTDDPWRRELFPRDEGGQEEEKEVVEEAFATQEHDDDGVSSSSSSSPASPVDEEKGRISQQEDETEKGSRDGDAPGDLDSSSKIHTFFEEGQVEGDVLDTEKPAAGETEEAYLEAPLELDSGSSISFSGDPSRRDLFAHDEVGQKEEGGAGQEEVVGEAFATEEHGEDDVSSSSSSSSLAMPLNEEKEQISQQEDEEERRRRDGEVPDDLESCSNVQSFFEGGKEEEDMLDTEKPVAGESQEGHIEALEESDSSSSVYFSGHASPKNDPSGQGEGELLSTEFIPEDSNGQHTGEFMGIGLHPTADIDMARESSAPFGRGVEEEGLGATNVSMQSFTRENLAQPVEEPHTQSFIGENLAQPFEEPLEDAGFIAGSALSKEGHLAEISAGVEPGMEPYTVDMPSQESIEEPHIQSNSEENLAQPCEPHGEFLPFNGQPTISKEGHLVETSADEESHTTHMPFREPIEEPHIPSSSGENLAQPFEDTGVETRMAIAQPTVSKEGTLTEPGQGLEPDMEPDNLDMPSEEPVKKPHIRSPSEENLAQPREDTCVIAQLVHLAETGAGLESDVQPYTADILSKKPIEQAGPELDTRDDLELFTETGKPSAPSVEPWHQDFPNKEIETLPNKDIGFLPKEDTENTVRSISEEKSGSLDKTSSGIQEPDILGGDQHRGSSNFLSLHEGFSGSDTDRKGTVEQGETSHVEVSDKPTISSEKQERDVLCYTSGMDEPKVKDHVVGHQHQPSRSQAPPDAEKAGDIHGGANMEESTEMLSAVKDQKSKDKGIMERNLLADVQAIMKIVGCHCDPHSSVMEQIRTLYIFLGVEPSSSDANDDDLEVASAELELLKAVVGVK